MKRILIFSFVLGLTTLAFAQSNPGSLINPSTKVATSASQSPADTKSQAKILDSHGKLPLSFEANQGQTDARVKFLSRAGGYTVFLTGDEAVLEVKASAPNRQSSALSHQPAAISHQASADKRPVKSSIVRMQLEGANSSAKVSGSEQLPGTSNYFIGKDPAQWRTNVPTYAKVKYEGIYPGIDLIYYGNQRQLEYDFIVAPGADPRRIAFDVSGANWIRRDARGDLVLKVREGEIRWHKPVAYQEKDGARQLVAARYAVTDTNRARFEVAKYDASRTLYIDPLIYSSYLGGSGGDYGNAIAVDGAGNAYVTGQTNSTDFPTTTGSFQTACAGGCSSSDVFVTKINASGSALVYSTYLGGSNNDSAGRIAVDSAGNAYVTGYTYSIDFPVTPGAFQTTLAGVGDAFVTKINPAGSAVVYSTYLGGSNVDSGSGIAVNNAGNVYVTGLTGSTDFPTTPGAFQTTCGSSNCSDAFVTELDPSGSALVYSTFLGGSSGDSASSIAVDNTGDAYVTGSTYSTDFPVTPGAFQTTCGNNCTYGDDDAFVTKFNPTGSALVYSTYLGGSATDSASAIAVDKAGNAYVTGSTYSADFPVTPGAFQTTCSGPYGCINAFIAKVNASGSALIYSTFLGGRSLDRAWGIAVDGAGNACVTGSTNSPDFPVTPGAFQTTCSGLHGCAKAFIAKVNASGSVLIYSTFLGGHTLDWAWGIAVDSARKAYVTGETQSTDFPVTPGAFQTTCNGGSGCGSSMDAFVTKLDVRAVPIITLTSSLNPSTYGQAVTFIAALTSTIGAPPDGETVSFMKGTTVLGTGTLSGGSASFTTSTLTTGTNNIKVMYGGDATFAPSTSKVVKQVVNKATTTTTLTSSLNPSNFGQAVTFTATVMPQYDGTIKGGVTFYDGTTALATRSLNGGVAKYTTSTLSRSTHTITATYNGNVNFLGSSASITQKVN